MYHILIQSNLRNFLKHDGIEYISLGYSQGYFNTYDIKNSNDYIQFMEAIDRNDEQTAKNLIDIYNFRPTTDIWPLHNLYSDRQILKYELYMNRRNAKNVMENIY